MTDRTVDQTENTQTEITISTFAEAKDAFRQKALRQALYDAGEVVMGDVLVNLHGDDHRARRRLENRLFRREKIEHYERDLFPEVIDATLAPHIAAGRAETVGLGHELMMNLSALAAGIDRPLGTAEESMHLYRYLMCFIEGATLAHYTGDRVAKAAEVSEQLDRFDREFLAPSIERRAALIERGEEPPSDILSVLIANDDHLHLPHHVLRREIAFYLLAGAHTSATAFTRTLHSIFDWTRSHPADLTRAQTDTRFVQRCLHETIRLHPSSPVAMRWNLEGVTLKSGRVLPAGQRTVIDLMSANRDPAIFGPRADEFDPHRSLPEGISPWGLSFGSGMHACIGADLAGGLLGVDGEPGEQDLYGLVPLAVSAVVRAGVRPDPLEAPEMDTTTARPYWGRYPVVFDMAAP